MKKLLPLLICIFLMQKLTGQDILNRKYRKSARTGISTNRSNFSMPAAPATVYSDQKDGGGPGGPLNVNEKKEFLDKNIPSVIGNTGFAPAFFDNLSIDFIDDQIKFSTGSFFRNSITKSFGGTISASAPNGSRALFVPGGKTPYDVSVELKYTSENKPEKWYLLDNGVPGPIISSVKNHWWNISIKGTQSKEILFLDDTSHVDRNPFTFEAFVSYNGIFNSFYVQKFVNRRILWHIGAGVGRLSNYETLDEINLRKGTLFGTDQFSESEVISGRTGELKSFTGAIIRGALYKPLSDPFSLTPVHLGLNLNSFAIGSNDHIFNGTFGVYFAKWKSETDDHDDSKRVLKELFSLGMLASFQNLQDAGKASYGTKNFKILITAQIPLAFL